VVKWCMGRVMSVNANLVLSWKTKGGGGKAS
jgi:hypothetical protein